MMFSPKKADMPEGFFGKAILFVIILLIVVLLIMTFSGKGNDLLSSIFNLGP